VDVDEDLPAVERVRDAAAHERAEQQGYDLHEPGHADEERRAREDEDLVGHRHHEDVSRQLRPDLTQVQPPEPPAGSQRRDVHDDGPREA
jgi:hypothetical protein